MIWIQHTVWVIAFHVSLNVPQMFKKCAFSDLWLKVFSSLSNWSYSVKITERSWWRLEETSHWLLVEVKKWTAVQKSQPWSFPWIATTVIPAPWIGALATLLKTSWSGQSCVADRNKHTLCKRELKVFSFLFYLWPFTVHGVGLWVILFIILWVRTL